MEKQRVQIFLNKKVNEKMRKEKIRKKGDVSNYIEGLIKKDLKIK